MALSLEEASEVRAVKTLLHLDTPVVPLFLLYIYFGVLLVRLNIRKWITGEPRYTEYGFPLCIQQLLQNGESLEDCTKLDAPMDIQLVLLPVSTAAQLERANLELMYACKHGHVEVARMLLEAGADKDLQAEAGKTALMHASLEGRLEIAGLLVETGVDLDLQADNGETALICAAENGCLEIARLLIQAGADIDLQDEYGMTALSHAAVGGQLEIAELLAEAFAET